MSGINMPELTPEEIKSMVADFEIFSKRIKEGIDESNTLFPEYNKQLGRNIYEADDFNWRATRLIKGGLAPKGKVSIVIKVIGKCRAATLISSDTTFDERRVVAYRLREQVRIDKGY